MGLEQDGRNHKSLLLAARELLIDLERTDLESVIGLDVTPGSPAAFPTGSPAAAASALAPEHKKVLLQQMDQLQESLLAEQQECARLHGENTQLAQDVRSLASQLKQERAASSALITGHASSSRDEGGTGEGGEHGGLTLANAASQILLLRREVKFLQKQWKTARLDQDSSSAREQMQQLRDEAADSQFQLQKAREASESANAKNRILVRELRAARAQVRAQQARMQRRSGAQREVASLREQLATAHDAHVQQSQQLKQLRLRAQLRGRADHEDEEGEEEEGILADAGFGPVADEAAHMSLGLLLLGAELSILERAWMAEKDAAAELVAIKANMSFQVAQVGDENVGLQAEVARLRERVSALQEEREIMQGSLNALTNDLSQAPLEQQHAASEAAAEAASTLSQPPPPPPPPPPPKMGAMGKGMSKLKFAMKKKEAVP